MWKRLWSEGNCDEQTLPNILYNQSSVSFQAVYSQTCLLHTVKVTDIVVVIVWKRFLDIM